jgi:hypothetical protein
MRQDQYERLQALEEELMDVFLFEADPAKWPGHGIEPGAMDRQTRGDRYWCKKNPAATLMIVTKVQALVCQTQHFGDTTLAGNPSAEEQEAEGELDKSIAAAEREAARLMSKMQGSSKEAFDRRVHGKP